MFELKNWSHTALNTPIELYASQKLDSMNLPILFIGGVHGDEPEGVHLAHNLLNFLRETTHLANDWLLVPCLNPDGLKLNQRVNSNGVDLNRNFPSKDWISTFEKKRYNPGPQAESEAETKAITQLIKQVRPWLIVHFHSWKPSIILTGPSDLVEATYFSESSNYPLELDIGYPTPGSLGQYSWQVHNTPVICIEEAELVDQNESWLRFKPAFEKLLYNK